MNIIWNKYTWYSKLAALIFFILVLPLWTFYLGRQYQRTINLVSISSELEMMVSQMPATRHGTSTNIVGIWQASEMMAAGWNNRYQFFPSGKYVYQRTQMDCSERALGHSGTWSITNNTLVLHPVVRADIVGGQIVKDPNCGAAISGGEIVETKYTNPVQYELMTCKTPKVDYYQCITLGKSDFYKFGSDPALYGSSNDGLKAEPVF